MSTLLYAPCDSVGGWALALAAAADDDGLDLDDDELDDLLGPVPVVAKAKFDPKLHLRVLSGEHGGEFRDMYTRVMDALRKWAGAGGRGDPLPGFEREPLRRFAVSRGIRLPRRADRDVISGALLEDLRGDLETGRTPAKKAPAKKAAPAVTPGSVAKRGDLVIVEEHSRDFAGPRFSVGVVTSVTRDGQVKSFREARGGADRKVEHLGEHKLHILSAERIDVDAALATARDNPWPNGDHKGKPYDSLDEAKAALKPHFDSDRAPAKAAKKAAPKAVPVKAPRTPAAPRKATPAAAAPLPGGRRLNDAEADSLSTAQFSGDGSVVTRTARTRASLERDGFMDDRGRITDTGRAALAAYQPPTFDARDAAGELHGLRDDPDALREALEGRNLTQLRAIFRAMRIPEPGSSSRGDNQGPYPFKLPLASQRRDAPRLRAALLRAFAHEQSRPGGETATRLRALADELEATPAAKKAVPATPPKPKAPEPRDIADEVNAQQSESDIIRYLSGGGFTAAKLKKVAEELDIDVPANVKAKTALQLHIAEKVARGRGLPGGFPEIPGKPRTAEVKLYREMGGRMPTLTPMSVDHDASTGVMSTRPLRGKWNPSKTGRTGHVAFDAPDGVYQAEDRYGTKYVVVEGGEARQVSLDEARQHLTGTVAQDRFAGAAKGRRALSAATVSATVDPDTDEAHLRGLPATVTPDDSQTMADAARRFGLETDPEVNRVLRARARGESPQVDPAIERDIADLRRLLTHSSLSRDVLVYRGTPDGSRLFAGDGWSGDLTGREWDDPAFASTTTAEDTAHGFALDADGEPGPNATVMRILAPRGTSAVATDAYAGDAALAGQAADVDERELLLAPTRYRVVRDYGYVTRDGDRVRRLDVEVVSAVPDGGGDRPASGRSDADARPSVADPDRVERLADGVSDITATSDGETPAETEQALRNMLADADEPTLRAVADEVGVAIPGRLRDADQIREHIVSSLTLGGRRRPGKGDAATPAAPQARPATSGRSALNAPTISVNDDREVLGLPADLTPEQRELITDGIGEYQSDSATFAGVNELLRDVDPSEIPELYRTDDNGRVIHGLDQAMARSTVDTDIVVYRGVHSPSVLFPDWEWNPEGGLEGKEWTDRAFGSTTVHEDLARDYTRVSAQIPSPEGTVLRIRVPRGTHALTLSQAREGTDFDPSREGEILLDRGLRYRIVADRGVADGIRYVDVDVVSSDQAPQALSTPPVKPAKKTTPRKTAAKKAPANTAPRATTGGGTDLLRTAPSRKALADSAIQARDTNPDRPHGDEMLYAIADRQGFTATPRRVDRATFDTMVASGQPELWRGMETQAHADQLVVGDYRAADNLGYGSGISLSEHRMIARRYGDDLVRVTLAPDARVMDIGEVLAGRDRRLAGLAPDDPQRLVFSDPGRYAAARGIDVIRIPGDSSGGERVDVDDADVLEAIAGEYGITAAELTPEDIEALRDPRNDHYIVLNRGVLVVDVESSSLSPAAARLDTSTTG